MIDFEVKCVIFLIILKLFINNEFIDAESGLKFVAHNPATGQEIAQLHEANSVDVDKAVSAARKAFEFGSEWRSMDASARGQLLMKFANLLKRDREYLAVNILFEKCLYFFNFIKN